MAFSELGAQLGAVHGYLSVTQSDNMKSILTLLFVVVLCSTAIANTGEDHVKVNPPSIPAAKVAGMLSFAARNFIALAKICT